MTPEYKEAKFSMDAELEALVARYRELKGQVTMQEVFKAVLTEYLDRHDPLRKKQTSAGRSHEVTTQPVQATNRHVPAAIRRLVFQRAQGPCQYEDTKGRRCSSRYRLEIDHITPYAMSQDHSPQNLRALCPEHNKVNAIQSFGWEKMQSYLRE